MTGDCGIHEAFTIIMPSKNSFLENLDKALIVFCFFLNQERKETIEFQKSKLTTILKSSSYQKVIRFS